MKRAPKVYSGTLDATKAAAFYDRMHTLKDALEALQAQYAEDIAAVVQEASESMSIEPSLINMAFTMERHKRKRDAKLAKLQSSKAQQLDLLLDAAAGTDGLSYQPIFHNPETGEIIEPDAHLAGGLKPESGMAAANEQARASSKASCTHDAGEVHGRRSEPTSPPISDIPAFLDRRVKPPPEPVH